MDSAIWILAAVVIIALVFDYINGMHDAANAIATVVSTRVLSPRQAIIMAAVLNFAGAFLSTAVAKTIGKGIVDPALITNGIVTAALLGAIAWNLLTWFFGIPSSSSHALIGGVVGGVASYHGLGVLNGEGIMKILKALVLSPLFGLAGGFVIMVAIMWIFRNARAGVVNRSFKYLQLLSASFMAISHGSNDAQKIMGVITMALFGMGYISDFHVPFWVIFACASAIAIGTATGGWRIIKTMGVKMIKLQPVNGFAAETAASAVILSATHFGVPVSTTHVISGSILGVGTAKRASAVRWGVAGNMLVAWVLTIPASALVAFAVGKAFKAFG
ncbi:MAG TPA: inorganic phosphate transporter [Fibrobacteria bacterium]|jgi:PiT family inorganic phosphate transporter|nr:inorganic phosphate transporter [Fibrobacteria bacterium]